jgi:hypothetical protein
MDLHAAQWVLVLFVGVGSLYWLATALGVVRVVCSVPVLARASPADPPRWGRLSVIIPACNEADTLERAMRSKLDQDYPDVEFVLVDDRSTDATGAIVDRLAAQDPRVRALHVTALPPGWLGKLHALDAGLAHATGEWLLFSDADVHLSPGVLRRAVALCEQRGVDHLAVFPEVWSTGAWLDTVMAAFTRVVLVAGRVWAAGDPKSRAAVGVGAFNLVRRSAFERTGGFEWLKLEVADDVGLAQMLKRTGARALVANGRDQVGLLFYRSVGEMARASEKAAVPFGFSLVRSALACAAVLALELAPFVGAATPSGVPGLQAASVAVALVAVVSAGVLNGWIGHRLLPALLVPLGSVMMVGVMLRGAVVSCLRGGVTWRGTLYPSKALLEGRRLQFP